MEEQRGKDKWGQQQQGQKRVAASQSTAEEEDGDAEEAADGDAEEGAEEDAEEGAEEDAEEGAEEDAEDGLFRNSQRRLGGRFRCT